MQLSFLEKKTQHVSLTYKAFNKLGITYFSYGRIQQGRVLDSCFSNKEWETLYKKKNYFKIDPLFLGVMRFNFPLIIWDALHPTDIGRRVMEERKEVCKIRSGLTIGLLNNTKREILALGANISPQELYELLKEEKYLSEIQHIIKCFYAPLEKN